MSERKHSDKVEFVFENGTWTVRDDAAPKVGVLLDGSSLQRQLDEARRYWEARKMYALGQKEFFGEADPAAVSWVGFKEALHDGRSASAGTLQQPNRPG